MAEFASNSRVNATTGYAPFELNYRYTVTHKTESMLGAFVLFIE